VINAQVYKDPVAIERMRENKCPECGHSAEEHSNDVRFWVPRLLDCNLLPRGVRERVAKQKELDDEEERQ
jgi:hypothetical protein